MSEIRIHSYEALVLFPQSAASDLGGCAEHVREILARADAELLALKKWDERRLAYDIRSNKRGVYFLAYFKAKTSTLMGIERDFNLSERVLRALVARVDHMTDEQMRTADGQQQLADEVKLRASGQPVGAASGEGTERPQA